MNTNSGEFVDDSRAEQWMKRVEVGQVIKILEEEFEITSIGQREMTVKLLSFREREANNFRDFFGDREKECARQKANLLKRQK